MGVQRQAYLQDQRFLMHAVGDSGKMLWRSLVIEKFEVINSITQKLSQSIAQFEAFVKPNKLGAHLIEQFTKYDAELKKLMSRTPVDEKDTSKRKAHLDLGKDPLRSIARITETNSSTEEVWLRMQCLRLCQRHMFLRVFYSLKKKLATLHERLQQVMVVQ